MFSFKGAFEPPCNYCGGGHSVEECSLLNPSKKGSRIMPETEPKADRPSPAETDLRVALRPLNCNPEPRIAVGSEWNVFHRGERIGSIGPNNVGHWWAEYRLYEDQTTETVTDVTPALATLHLLMNHYSGLADAEATAQAKQEE
jgi:hypothetical protein